MNNFILILLSFLSLSLCSQNDLSSSNIEVVYAKGYKNFRDTTSTPPRLMKDLEYQLLCNSNESRFEYLEAMSNDGTTNNERFIGRGGGSGVYYKNLSTKEKLRQLIGNDESQFLVNQYFNKYSWKLHKESKMILGYNCFKATTEYKFFHYFKNKDAHINITVWYAPSIPISFGPSGYDGLPGLVLESHQASFYFIATDIKFHKKPKPIKRPVRGIEINEEEFNKSLFEDMLKRTNSTKEEWYEMIKNRTSKK